MKSAITFTALLAITYFGSLMPAQECSSTATATSGQTTSFVNTNANPVQQKNIVETAAANQDFSTLVAAVKAADLAGALSGEGPFTVFAPTNGAFDNLPAGTVESLLEPANKQKLADVLKYHVVSGKVMAKDVLKGMNVDTLQGSKANIGLTIDGARIVKADIECSNGVIHVIDAVIMPKSK